MSLLLDTTFKVCAHWTTSKRDVFGHQNNEFALLGSTLFRSLVSDDSAQRLCISISTSAPALSPQLPLVCWARLTEEMVHNQIIIPASWPTKYPHVFLPASLHHKLEISLANIIPLTSVIATIKSGEPYAEVIRDLSFLEEWFSEADTILRQGDTYVFDVVTRSNTPSYVNVRLEILEPVFQGSAKQGTTKIILMPPSLGSPNLDLAMTRERERLEHDYIEIDENFLASSILAPPIEKSRVTQPYDIPSKDVENDLQCHSNYLCNSLQKPSDPRNDHSSLYMRAANLGKIGLLNGDWAIAGNASSQYRLVRIIADDSLNETGKCIRASPLLLYNILSSKGDDSPPYSAVIQIHPSPFGSSSPAMPTAQSIAVARVASPISVNRLYQDASSLALKRYFDAEKRIVKHGDIIAVSIDTDSARLMTEPAAMPHNYSTEVLIESSGQRVNDIVFFKVTNIEYDVVSTGISVQDLYAGSTSGELGCWVDTTITRVVQTGIEHAKVPNVRAYLLGSENAFFLNQLMSWPSAFLLGPHSPYSKILSLSSAALVQKAADYGLNLSFLMKGARGVGKFTVASWVSQRLGIHLLEVNCYEWVGENDVKTEAALRFRFEQASACTPCVLVLRNLEALSQTTQPFDQNKESAAVTALRECMQDIQGCWKMSGYPVIVFGTTSEPGRVPSGLLSCFKQEVTFEAPNEGERLEILRCLLYREIMAVDVSLQHLAAQTAALLAGDLRDLVTRAKMASIHRVEQLLKPVAGRPSLLNTALLAADFEVALGQARDSYSVGIGAPKIPNVSWDDVGGLSHVKSDILDTIQLPLDHPELFADGLKKRSGILLYGPPGTGKTLIAKAVATSCSLNFFSVKGPELLNMYIGESEANVRRVFQRARDAKPCVIFFDELDSVAPKRGNQGDSGGVMDRIVSQLLAELDGMSGSKAGADVFVIGATNRPDLLDPALLRPGRFDRMLYLGVSDNHDAQLNILHALTRKFRLEPDLDLHKVAQKSPFNYTGADFYALCSDAMLNAMSRKAEEVERTIATLNLQAGPHKFPHPITAQYFLSEVAGAEDITVFVSQSDFDRALESLVPSVSQAEMDHYAQVQMRFSRETQ